MSYDNKKLSSTGPRADDFDERQYLREENARHKALLTSNGIS